MRMYPWFTWPAALLTLILGRLSQVGWAQAPPHRAQLPDLWPTPGVLLLEGAETTGSSLGF